LEALDNKGSVIKPEMRWSQAKITSWGLYHTCGKSKTIMLTVHQREIFVFFFLQVQNKNRGRQFDNVIEHHVYLQTAIAKVRVVWLTHTVREKNDGRNHCKRYSVRLEARVNNPTSVSKCSQKFWFLCIGHIIGEKEKEEKIIL
jgi:hypothetical protein